MNAMIASKIPTDVRQPVGRHHTLTKGLIISAIAFSYFAIALMAYCSQLR